MGLRVTSDMARIGLAVATAAAALSLAGCGYKSSLTRLPLERNVTDEAEKSALADKRAEEKRVVETGLSVPSTTNPERIDELRLPLDERPLDPFALPPEGTDENAPAPFPKAGDGPVTHDRFLKNRS